MTTQNMYKEILDFCYGAQKEKNLLGWQSLHEFDNLSENKNFNARVYKQGQRIVISFAGSTSVNDYLNNKSIIMNHTPSQYADTERLYNQVKAKYPDAHIESTGYSLGGTLSNLLSHRTGIKSTAIAPIGSKHIANTYPQYFKYGDSNITTYGRKGDKFFYNNIDRQSGNVYIIPDMPKEHSKELFAQHLLHNYNPYDIYLAKPYKKETYTRPPVYSDISNSRIDNPSRLQRTQLTGFAAPAQNFNHIFTPEEIGRMSNDEFAQNEAEIMQQMLNGLIQNRPPKVNYSGYSNPIKQSRQIFSREDISAMSIEEYSKNKEAINAQLNSIGIPSNSELHAAAIAGKGAVYVRPYHRANGTPDRGYYRSN